MHVNRRSSRALFRPPHRAPLPRPDPDRHAILCALNSARRRRRNERRRLRCDLTSFSPALPTWADQPPTEALASFSLYCSARRHRGHVLSRTPLVRAFAITRRGSDTCKRLVEQTTAGVLCGASQRRRSQKVAHLPQGFPELWLVGSLGLRHERVKEPVCTTIHCAWDARHCCSRGPDLSVSPRDPAMAAAEHLVSPPPPRRPRTRPPEPSKPLTLSMRPRILGADNQAGGRGVLGGKASLWHASPQTVESEVSVSVL